MLVFSDYVKTSTSIFTKAAECLDNITSLSWGSVPFSREGLRHVRQILAETLPRTFERNKYLHIFLADLSQFSFLPACLYLESLSGFLAF